MSGFYCDPYFIRVLNKVYSKRAQVRVIENSKDGMAAKQSLCRLMHYPRVGGYILQTGLVKYS